MPMPHVMTMTHVHHALMLSIFAIRRTDSRSRDNCECGYDADKHDGKKIFHCGLLKTIFEIRKANKMCFNHTYISD